MRRLLLILLGLTILAGIGYAIVNRSGPAATAARRSAAVAPVPVLVARAETQDVDIWLSGLGTVQAFNTVTVRSMIDGPLVKVGFAEGDEVKAGAVLARIDPRP